MTVSGSGSELPGPLAGLRVLELTGEHAQFCGKLMADLGADVIKIEPPGELVDATILPPSSTNVARCDGGPISEMCPRSASGFRATTSPPANAPCSSNRGSAIINTLP